MNTLMNMYSSSRRHYHLCWRPSLAPQLSFGSTTGGNMRRARQWRGGGAETKSQLRNQRKVAEPKPVA